MTCSDCQNDCTSLTGPWPGNKWVGDCCRSKQPGYDKSVHDHNQSDSDSDSDDESVCEFCDEPEWECVSRKEGVWSDCRGMICSPPSKNQLLCKYKNKHDDDSDEDSEEEAVPDVWIKYKNTPTGPTESMKLVEFMKVQDEFDEEAVLFDDGFQGYIRKQEEAVPEEWVAYKNTPKGPTMTMRLEEFKKVIDEFDEDVVDFDDGLQGYIRIQEEHDDSDDDDDKSANSSTYGPGCLRICRMCGEECSCWNYNDDHEVVCEDCDENSEEELPGGL
jgi:hypothetical protein